MPRPVQRNDITQSMLGSITEATVLCYHAQCHYIQASNLTAARPYHPHKYVDSQHEPLFDALRDTHLGSEKLKRAFSCLQTNLKLAENFPAMLAETTANLLELNSLLALSPAFGSANDQKPRTKQEDLLKCQSSMLRIINQCGKVATYQRKLLKEVIDEILNEIPFIVPSMHQLDSWQNHFPHNGHDEDYCNRHHQQNHSTIGPPVIPERSEDEAIPDEFDTKCLALLQKQLRFVTKGSADGRSNQEHQCGSRQTPDFHSKRRALFSKSVKDYFEPLTVDEGIDLLTESGDLRAATNVVPKTIETVGPIKPNSIFPDIKIEPHFPEDTTMKASGTTYNRATLKSASSLPSPLNQKLRAVRRIRSMGCQPKHKQRRSPEQRKKTKAVVKDSSSTGEHNESALLALALGGRKDFLEEGAVFEKKGGNKSWPGDIDRARTSDLSFNNHSMVPRSHSF